MNKNQRNRKHFSPEKRLQKKENENGFTTFQLIIHMVIDSSILQDIYSSTSKCLLKKIIVEIR